MKCYARLEFDRTGIEGHKLVLSFPFTARQGSSAKEQREEAAELCESLYGDTIRAFTQAEGTQRHDAIGVLVDRDWKTEYEELRERVGRG